MRWKLKPGNCALQSPTLGDIKKAPIRGRFVVHNLANRGWHGSPG